MKTIQLLARAFPSPMALATTSIAINKRLVQSALQAGTYLHADPFFLHALHKDGPKRVIRVFFGSVQEVGYENNALNNIGFAKVWPIIDRPVQSVHCNCQGIHKITAACALQAPTTFKLPAHLQCTFASCSPSRATSLKQPICAAWYL